MRRRWNFWDDMRDFENDMDDLFGGVWRPGMFRKDIPLLEGPGKKELAHWRRPLADMMETDKEIISKFELPGLDKNDIKLNLTEDTLEIKAEKKSETKEERKGYYNYERSYSGFYRCMNLPQKINPDKVETSFKNGILEIKMPKIEPGKSKVREIRIK